MDLEYRFLLILLAGLAVNAALQVGTARGGWLRSLFFGFLGGYGLCLALGICVLFSKRTPFLEWLGLVLAVTVTYAACGFFYFNVVNGRQSALRVRLLAELREAPDGLTMREMLVRYSPREMYLTRMGRLTKHGQVIEREGKLFVGKPAMITIARIMVFMKLLVVGRRSEFE